MSIESANPRRITSLSDSSRAPRLRTTRAIVGVVLALVLMAAALPASAQEEDDGSETTTSLAGAEASATTPEIVFPVVGPVTYTDTWGACRGSGCSRGHKGVDIFGHKLAPLVAAEDGVITFVRQSAMSISGNTVIIRSDSGWRYLYIHLNNDAPGTDDGSNPQGWIVPNRLRAGDRVTAGQVIGYLGDSGNAETTPAHVHFEVHEPGVGAVNPTPLVRAAQQAGRTVSVASLASSPEGRAESAPVVDAWYRALLKREPTSAELFAWTDRFDIGFATTDDLIADLTMAKARRDPAGAIVRSYRVSLDRLPTINELRQWEQVYRDGGSLEEITEALISSQPFADAHGTLTDEDFVRVIYRNAIDREPSAERLADWVELFAEGSPRSALTAYWADSYAVKDSTWHGLEVVQAFRAAADRMPTDDEYGRWVSHLDGGGLIPDVVAGIRNPEAEAETETDDTETEAETDTETEAETDDTMTDDTETDDTMTGDTAEDGTGDADPDDTGAEDGDGATTSEDGTATTADPAAETTTGDTAETGDTGG